MILLLSFLYAVGFTLTADYALKYFCNEPNDFNKYLVVTVIAILWVFIMPLHWMILSPDRSK